MTCTHCGKEYNDDYLHCPYCATPNLNPEIEKEYIKKVNQNISKLKIRAIITSVVFTIVAVPCLGPIGLVMACVLAVCLFVYVKAKHKSAIKTGKQFTINAQFTKDQTSICPKCGSHNIRIYRNGYEWNKGYWMRIFDVKGGSYIAGINSNNARCRCINCGNDWLTDYDYRIIK